MIIKRQIFHRWSRNSKQYGKWLKVYEFVFISSLIFLISKSTFQCPHPRKTIDSVQDLSLLRHSPSNSNLLRRLGQCLDVPPQILGHLQGFQGLFQYLCHLHVHAAGPGSFAPALSPCPEVVTRVHRAVVNK